MCKFVWEKERTFLRETARGREIEGRVCVCVRVCGYMRQCVPACMFDCTFRCRPCHSCLFSKAVICGLSCHLLVSGSHHHYDLHSRSEHSIQLQMSRCHSFTHRVDRVYRNFALIPEGTYFIKDPVCAFLPIPLLQTCGMWRQQTHTKGALVVFFALVLVGAGPFRLVFRNLRHRLGKSTRDNFAEHLAESVHAKHLHPKTLIEIWLKCLDPGFG